MIKVTFSEDESMVHLSSRFILQTTDLPTDIVPTGTTNSTRKILEKAIMGQWSLPAWMPTREYVSFFFLFLLHKNNYRVIRLHEMPSAESLRGLRVLVRFLSASDSLSYGRGDTDDDKWGKAQGCQGSKAWCLFWQEMTSLCRLNLEVSKWTCML